MLDPIVTQTNPLPSDSDILDYTHAGHLAGWTEGFAQGQRFADEDRAHEIIHRYACRWTEQAVRTAAANHGAGWADEIRRACFPDGEVA